MRERALETVLEEVCHALMKRSSQTGTQTDCSWDLWRVEFSFLWSSSRIDPMIHF